MTHSPGQRPGMSKRSGSGYDAGANKRARYWLGDQAANLSNDQDADMEDEEMWNEDDQVDVDYTDIMFDGDEYCDDYDDEADDEADAQIYKAAVRGVSEDIAASMEMDD